VGARVVTFDPCTYDERGELWNALPSSMRACIEARSAGSLEGMAAAHASGERFEAALLDSIHTEEHVFAEFELASKLVCKGGLILVHDAVLEAGTVARALERIDAAGYGVTRLWTAEAGVVEGERAGLAVIENRRRGEPVSALPATELCELARKYGCDKEPSLAHGYTPFYHALFSERRRDVARLLEIGIGVPDVMTGVPGYARGASLRMWRDYFPNAEIHGVDVRPDALFADERIATHLCDQSRRDDLDALLRRIEDPFDIVIDDGSHETEHQLVSAAALIPHVKAGGIYVIEDAKEPERLVSELGVMGYEATAHRFHHAWDDTLVVVRCGLAPLE
jgi:hypothetical protein